VGGFLWLRGKELIPQFMDVENDDQVVLWKNQFPPDLDQAAVNSFNVPLLPIQRPVWTPNVTNGLGMLQWETLKSTSLSKVYPIDQGPVFNEPTNDGEPILMHAVVHFDDGNGGNIVTLRMTSPYDLEFCMRVYLPVAGKQLGITSDQDAFGYVFSDGIVDYTGQTILITWEYWGSTIAGANPIPNVYINGVLRPLDPAWGPIGPYDGVVGMSIGFVNATANGWPNAKIGEVLGYRGGTYANAAATFPSIRAASTAYLMEEWGLT